MDSRTASQLLHVLQLPSCCICCSCLASLCAGAAKMLYVLQLIICSMCFSCLSDLCAPAAHLLYSRLCRCSDDVDIQLLIYCNSASALLLYSSHCSCSDDVDIQLFICFILFPAAAHLLNSLQLLTCCTYYLQLLMC